MSFLSWLTLNLEETYYSALLCESPDTVYNLTSFQPPLRPSTPPEAPKPPTNDKKNDSKIDTDVIPLKKPRRKWSVRVCLLRLFCRCTMLFTVLLAYRLAWIVVPPVESSGSAAYVHAAITVKGEDVYRALAEVISTTSFDQLLLIFMTLVGVIAELVWMVHRFDRGWAVVYSACSWMLTICSCLVGIGFIVVLVTCLRALPIDLFHIFDEFVRPVFKSCTGAPDKSSAAVRCPGLCELFRHLFAIPTLVCFIGCLLFYGALCVSAVVGHFVVAIAVIITVLGIALGTATLVFHTVAAAAALVYFAAIVVFSLLHLYAMVFGGVASEIISALSPYYSHWASCKPVEMRELLQALSDAVYSSREYFVLCDWFKKFCVVLVAFIFLLLTFVEKVVEAERFLSTVADAAIWAPIRDLVGRCLHSFSTVADAALGDTVRGLGHCLRAGYERKRPTNKGVCDRLSRWSGEMLQEGALSFWMIFCVLMFLCIFLLLVWFWQDAIGERKPVLAAQAALSTLTLWVLSGYALFLEVDTRLVARRQYLFDEKGHEAFPEDLHANAIYFLRTFLWSFYEVFLRYCTLWAQYPWAFSIIAFLVLAMHAWLGTFLFVCYDRASKKNGRTLTTRDDWAVTPRTVYRAVTFLPFFFVAAGVALHTFSRLLVAAGVAFSQLLLSLSAALLATAVPTLRNPIHSLLSLICMFLVTVVIFLFLGAEFLSLVFLIVYVGAVAILFLFVIMLLNVKSLTSSTALFQRTSQEVGLATVFCLVCVVLDRLLPALFGAIDHATALLSFSLQTVQALLHQVRYLAADVMAFATLYTEQAALFLLITVILLCAMLGAIVLATATLDEDEPTQPQPVLSTLLATVTFTQAYVPCDAGPAPGEFPFNLY